MTPEEIEHLACLLWDYFGPRTPRSNIEILDGMCTAERKDVAAYRECAHDIAESLAGPRVRGELPDGCLRMPDTPYTDSLKR